MSFQKSLLLVFALAFLLRAFPLSIDAMMDPDHWFHTRMAETVVAEQQVPKYDALSMQGRAYSYAPLFHVFIATFSIFSSINVRPLAPLLPVFYGSMAVLLVYAFARRFFSSKSIALFAALAIALTPLHIMRTAANVRPDSLALLVVPAIIFLVYYKKFIPVAILTIALVLLHPLSSFYLFSFLFIWMLVARFKRIDFSLGKTFAIILLGIFAWLLWLYSLPYSPSQYISMVSFESVENTRPLLLDFFTFFTFSWIFILIGLVKLDIRKNTFLLAWFLFSLLYGAFSIRLAIFLTIPAALIAANGFKDALEKTRKFFPLLILLLFIFSTLAVVNHANSIGWFASPPERKAMQWLQNTPQNSIIASQWDRGHPLAYLAKRPVMIDGYFEFAPQLEERNESMKVLISSSDCNKLLAQKQRWGIDYFYVHYTALDSLAYKNGILEADCNFISQVYASDFARVLGFD